MDKEALLELAQLILIGAGSLSAAVFFLISPFMFIVWWVYKNNIKKSEQLLQGSAQKIEDVEFFKSNQKYNEIIKKQIDETKELSKIKENLINEIADLEKEKERKSKK